MSSLSGKAGALIVANFVKYAIGFAMPLVLVRLLTRDEYGTWQQLLLVGTIATTLCVSGVPLSVYYFFRRDQPARNATLRLQSSLVLAAAALAATLVVLAAGPLIAQRMGNPALLPLLPPFFLSVALAIACEHFGPFMIAADRYGTAVGFETVEAAARIPLLVAPLVLGWGLPGLAWALAGFALVRMTLRLGVLWSGRGEGFPAPGTPRAPWFLREQFAYSTPLALTAVAGLISATLDRALVATSVTPAQYALYAVGALEIPLDVIFQAAVANVVRAAIPGLVREGRHPEVARVLREAVRKLSMVVLPSFVFLFGHASAFVALMFTDAYLDSVPVFRIYLLLVPLHMFVLSAVPQAYGRTKLNLRIVLTVCVLHVLGSVVLLQTVGWLGPAMSAVAAQWLQSLLFLLVVRRLVGAPLHALLPLAGIAKVLAASGIALLASWWVSDGGGWTGFLASAATFSVVWVVAMVALRAFTDEDRATLRRLLARVWPTAAGGADR